MLTGPMAVEFERALGICVDEASCERAASDLLRSMCPDPSLCSLPQRGARANYDWIEKLLERGVPDGRHRLILYVLSRYLVNVKGLDEREATAGIAEFVQRSCRNFGNCTKVYESWIRNVVSKVKAGGWKPWTLEKLKEKDPQLYSTVVDVIGGAQG